MKTKPLIDQHIHGAFGVDFNTAAVDDVLYLAREIRKIGVGGIFPTLVTDSIENIKRQTGIIKTAAQKQEPGENDYARILGIHLEGIFLNPAKKGIHDEKHFLLPSVENFRLIEDDFIKIVTLAPERVEGDLIGYLHEKETKVQAGHCIGGDLEGIDGVTHLFNAMEGISHKKSSTTLSALVNDNIYTEVIADGVHLSDDILKLIFKSKPADKILLVSDALPVAHYKSACKIVEAQFAGKKIFYDGECATSKEGTLAGSTSLLPDIIKMLIQKDLFNPQFIENLYNYHNMDLPGWIEF